jgi:hypothetical protein
MTYDADAAIEFELERLRLLQRQRHSERMGIRQEVLPAIKSRILGGEGHVPPSPADTFSLRTVCSASNNSGPLPKRFINAAT